MLGPSLSLVLFSLSLSLPALATAQDHGTGQVEAEVGKPVRIPCSADIPHSIDISKIVTQWFVNEGSERQRIYFKDNKNNVTDNLTAYTGRISVDAEYALTINEVKLMDNRTFYCQVGAGPQGNSEGMSKLQVYAIPTIPRIHVRTISASVLDEGVTEIAACSSHHGYPAPSIRWYKDQTPLESVTTRNSKMYMVLQITETSNKFMTVSSILYYKLQKQDKDSRFYCEVSYKLPGGVRKVMESERISIMLIYPTENVNLTMEPSVLMEGDSVKLKCISDGNSMMEYTFSWKMDSGEETSLASTGDTVMLETLTRSDSGMYICLATDMDTLLSFQDNVSVIVNYLDPIELTPGRVVNLTRGDTNVELHCQAMGSQEISTVWTKDMEKSPLGVTNTLRLPQVGFETAGNYRCEVSMPNVPGLAHNDSISVVVQGAPEIVANSTKVSGREEEDLNLSCTFRGFPQPNVTWSVPGIPTVKMLQQNGVITVVSQLILPLTDETQRVMCNATNIQGSKSFLFHVRRKDISPPATVSPTAMDGIRLKGTRHKKSSGGVVIVAIIVCILVLAILGAVLYFLYKKGKIACGRSGKQDITHTDAHDNIVVEAKNEQKVPEETVLLQGVNGEKRPPGDQSEEYADLRSEGK